MIRSALNDDQVRIRPLGKTTPGPVMIETTTEPLYLSDWAKNHGEELDGLLRSSGAVLLRGFTMDGIRSFESFVGSVSKGDRLPYIDRSTPRIEKTDRVYTATTYPAEYAINLHNEGTYWIRWPLKLFFYCTRPAQSGGQTPIANVSNVLGRIDGTIRQKFETRQIMYVRNYNRGLGLTWQQVFQTERKEVVEDYCLSNDIEVTWGRNDRLQTRQTRPAIRVNPKTGKSVWFNHAAFFNIHALEPGMREVVVKSFPPGEYPYNTFFGDGEQIDADVVEHIQDAYKLEEIVFDWEKGDVLLLDNMTFAHGRRPYTGDREVLVAMTEASNK